MLAGILIISGIVMVFVAHQESAIMDELAHIPAGYGYIHELDARLNPEHPPLVKILSALPLLGTQLSFPSYADAWQHDINGQWIMGSLFMYWSNANNADTIIFLSRLFPILLTLLLVLLVFIWARERMGPRWALIPTILVGFSPHILAHGHYVTTDIGAALGFMLCLYGFTKFLNHQTNKALIIAGIFFGIAQLTKFSSVLIIPIMIGLAIVYWCAWRSQKNVRFFSKENIKTGAILFIKTVGVFAIGMLLVWMIYGIIMINHPIEKQIYDTVAILESFGGGRNGETITQHCLPPSLRCLAEINIWMAHTPIIRSFGQYVLGVLMVMQRASGGNTAYFLGDVGAGGWWYYFPVVYFFKEALPVLILIGIGVYATIKQTIKNRKTKRQTWYSYVLLNTPELAMITFIAVYWVYSIKSPLNIGVRHVLPTIPFIYILITGSIKKWIEKSQQESSGNKMARIKKITITLLMLWVTVETVYAFPYYLSYFNQLGGGVTYGWKTVTDSNYDWGQDLKRLKVFVEKNDISKIAVDYFGGGDVKYYLKERAYYWNSEKGNPIHSDIHWIAVSVNSLMGAKGKTLPGFIRKPQDSYDWIENWENPYQKAGTSIFIYKLK